MPDYSLQIENNTHPVFYAGRPGQGTAYSRIDSVVLTENKIIIHVTVFNCPPDASHYDITIDDPTCMKLLPFLLNGEISCMDALQQLMPYFMEKYPTQLRQTPLLEGVQKSRMLQLELCGTDGFVQLCQFYPHECEDRAGFYSIPRKAVDEEIVEAINLFLDPSYNTLRNITKRFIQSNLSLFPKIRDIGLPPFLADELLQARR